MTRIGSTETAEGSSAATAPVTQPEAPPVPAPDGGSTDSTAADFGSPGLSRRSYAILLLLAVIVGGSGRFFGPLLGTVVIVLLPEWLRFMQNWYLAAFGFAIVALMIWLPGGILSIPDRINPRRRAR